MLIAATLLMTHVLSFLNACFSTVLAVLPPRSVAASALRFCWGYTSIIWWSYPLIQVWEMLPGASQARVQTAWTVVDFGAKIVWAGSLMSSNSAYLRLRVLALARACAHARLLICSRGSHHILAPPVTVVASKAARARAAALSELRARLASAATEADVGAAGADAIEALFPTAHSKALGFLAPGEDARGRVVGGTVIKGEELMSTLLVVSPSETLRDALGDAMAAAATVTERPPPDVGGPASPLRRSLRSSLVDGGDAHRSSFGGAFVASALRFSRSSFSRAASGGGRASMADGGRASMADGGRASMADGGRSSMADAAATPPSPDRRRASAAQVAEAAAAAGSGAAAAEAAPRPPFCAVSSPPFSRGAAPSAGFSRRMSSRARLSVEDSGRLSVGGLPAGSAAALRRGGRTLLDSADCPDGINSVRPARSARACFIRSLSSDHPSSSPPPVCSTLTGPPPPRRGRRRRGWPRTAR